MGKSVWHYTLLLLLLLAFLLFIIFLFLGDTVTVVVSLYFLELDVIYFQLIWF